MFQRVVLAALLFGFVVEDANGQFNRHRRRGTILGGVAGAAVGAAIGDRSDNEAVGAVIGGVAGAAIGRSIGTRKDQRIEGSHYYSSPTPARVYSTPFPHRYPHQPQLAPPIQLTAPPHYEGPIASAAPAIQPISHNDVVAMLQGGLSEPMVISQVQRHGINHALTVGDVIRLHQQGVSERLIEIMQAHVVHHEEIYPPHNPAVQDRSYPRAVEPSTFQPFGESILAPGVELHPAR